VLNNPERQPRFGEPSLGNVWGIGPEFGADGLASWRQLPIRVVTAQKQHAITVDDPDANAVKPTRAVHKIPGECRVFSEEND